MTERITSTSAELMQAPPKWTNGLLRGICVVFLSLLLWASWAEIEAMVFAEGKVIPAGDIQVVQNLEGGIVSEIVVKSGDRVYQGELLLRINNVNVQSQLAENRQRLFGIDANIARLDAEIEGRQLSFAPQLIQAVPEIVDGESKLYQTRKDELEKSQASIKKQIRQRKQELLETQKKINLLGTNIGLMEEEVQVSLDLVEQGALSKVEALQLQRQLNELQAERQSAMAGRTSVKSEITQLRRQLDEKNDRFLREAVAKRNELEISRNQLRETMVASSDKASRTEVRAPVTGIVNRVLVNTIGGVISPGMDLIELVPAEDNLLVEARVKPEDIGFLTRGQQAIVRLTAYDFAVYGSLDGIVEHIGADTIEDDQGNQFYQIKVRTKESMLQRGTEDLPILPGMIAQVDVITGMRTVLSYLSKPITRTKQKALRER